MGTFDPQTNHLRILEMRSQENFRRTKSEKKTSSTVNWRSGKRFVPFLTNRFC